MRNKSCVNKRMMVVSCFLAIAYSDSVGTSVRADVAATKTVGADSRRYII